MKKPDLKKTLLLAKEVIEFSLAYLITGMAFGTCFGIFFGYILIAYELGGLVGLLSAVAGTAVVIGIIYSRYKKSKKKKRRTKEERV